MWKNLICPRLCGDVKRKYKKKNDSDRHLSGRDHLLARGLLKYNNTTFQLQATIQSDHNRTCSSSSWSDWVSSRTQQNAAKRSRTQQNTRGGGGGASPLAPQIPLEKKKKHYSGVYTYYVPGANREAISGIYIITSSRNRYLVLPSGASGRFGVHIVARTGMTGMIVQARLVLRRQRGDPYGKPTNQPVQ